MPTVRELSALYENIMVAPRRGPGVCDVCLTFTDGYSHCYTCANSQPWLDAMAPISYSVAHEQLHHALASYKRLAGEPARRLQTQLAAVLWRYLEAHEACLARQLGLAYFPVVTSVPSGRPEREDDHPLRRIVATLCGATRERYTPILRPSGADAGEHAFDPERFTAVAALQHRPPVLLIDDTWTTGANAQSAAAALKRAGSGPVALVVIGRHLKRDWRENDARLRAADNPTPYDWTRCVHCVEPASIASGA